jgi:hypothetical protein
MESQHTPAPWEWTDGNDFNDNLRLVGKDGELICHFGNREAYYPTEGEEPSEEDQRLIAAAPDLLEAAKMALDALIVSVNLNLKHIETTAVPMLRDAIEKAVPGSFGSCDVQSVGLGEAS